MGARGFTLIELLVIVAIIAVLAAVLFPPRQPRMNVKQIDCITNLKQLASAAEMYTHDWNDYYPPRGMTCLDPAPSDTEPNCRSGALDRNGRSVGYAETWQGGGLVALAPYVRNPKVLWCPAQPDDFPLTTDPRSYYNGFEWLLTPRRVEYPENKVLLLEAYSFHDVKPPVRFDDPPNPHRRFVVAFVDGHVKLTRLSDGCSGSSHPNCAGWVSCLGPGGNGNYLCSGAGEGAKARDFP